MLIRGADQTPYGLLTLRTIRNKIIDRADEALELANTPLVWDEIKSNLIRLYSSEKSEANLLSELSTFSDGQTLGQLFFGISKVRSQLFSILKNSEHNNTVIDAKKVVYNEVCLNAFITGLREPLKTFVRLKSPSTLEQAYEQCQIEQTLYRAQNNRSNRTEQRSNESDGRNQRNNNDNNNRNGRNDQNDRGRPYSNSNQNRSSNSYNRAPQSGNNDNQTSTSNPFRTPSHSLNNIEENPQSNPNFQQPASGSQQGT